jgi:helicase
MQTKRFIDTRSGRIPLPAVIPVTTFSGFPLDDLIRPYLPRLSHAMMVSPKYAKDLEEPPTIPLLVDSGGFLSLSETSKVVSAEETYESGLGYIEYVEDETTKTVRPQYVLELQERIASVGFTLDFAIKPGTEGRECHRRLNLTVNNALWAVKNKRRKDLVLFGSVQGWHKDSYRECARAYKNAGFDGLAIGGLVPRSRNREELIGIIRAVREETELPVHAFGIGNPDLTGILFSEGIDSVDSSSYIRLAADGRLWSNPDFQLIDATPTERLHLALLNLAAATGRALPISAHKLSYKTHLLDFEQK